MYGHESVIDADRDEARDPALSRDALRAGWGIESRSLAYEDRPSRQEAEADL